MAAKLRQKNLAAVDIVGQFRALAETIEAAPVELVTLRDPDDAAVLACALAARADLLVSGDLDLLVTQTYQHIRIVSATEAVHLVERQA